MDDQIKQIAAIEVRLTALEKYPARVEAIERKITSMESDIKYTRRAMDEMKKTGEQSNQKIDQVRDDLNRLFWTGAGMAGAVSVVWMVGIAVWKFVGSTA